MTDLILYAVTLWAVLAILLHLGLIGYATICQKLSWWESPWVKWLEKMRRALAVIISGLFLLALLTGCANRCPCRPKIPPDRILHLIQIPTLGSAAVLDSGIGIECRWPY